MSFSVNTSPFAGREVLSACPCSFPYFTTFCIHLFSLNLTYGCHLLSAVCLVCAEIFLEFLVRDPSFLTVNILFHSGKVCHKSELTRSTLSWIGAQLGNESYWWRNCRYICCEWSWHITYYDSHWEYVSWFHLLPLFFYMHQRLSWHEMSLAAPTFSSLIFSNNHTFVKFAMVFKATMTLQKCSSESWDNFMLSLMAHKVVEVQDNIDLIVYLFFTLVLDHIWLIGGFWPSGGERVMNSWLGHPRSLIVKSKERSMNLMR